MLPKFRNPALLERALTHRSYLNEFSDISEDNERLEFLGDAVLGFVTAAMLYETLPNKAEGKMTRLRSALVRNERLAEVARALGMAGQIRMGKGEEDGGGRDREHTLGSALEAVIGAYYLDSGIEAVRAWLVPLLAPALRHVMAEQKDQDAKSRFQEYAQGVFGITPHYAVQIAEGPEHARSWKAAVFIGETSYGSGIGTSKRAAQQAAATDALQRLDLI